MFDVYTGAVVIVMSYCEAAEGKLWEKRNDFKWHLNMCSDGDDVTCRQSVPDASS